MGDHPHARGLPGREGRVQAVQRGIIPTRGVYQGLAFSGALTSGSSPLARGLRAHALTLSYHRRIIPARAGFTRSAHRESQHPGDHPRSRGVYVDCRVSGAAGEGSSPLARGLRASARDATRMNGIIPARAGFTHRARVAEYFIQDHPRSRGVYRPVSTLRERVEGSSPLARGLRHLCRLWGQERRIIPARAGFTSRSPSRGRCTGDHPRSRGVYMILT